MVVLIFYSYFVTYDASKKHKDKTHNMFLVLRNRWYSWLKVATDAQELKIQKNKTKLYFIHNKPSQIQLKLMILLEGKNCGSSSQPTIKWTHHKNSRYKNEDIMMQHKKAIQNGLRIMVSYSPRPIGSSGPTNPFFQGEGLITTQCCIFSLPNFQRVLI